MDRAWDRAADFADLGEAMAGWLEGHVDGWPGCSATPDDETLPLAPLLAALNRRGLVTTCSQPVETFTNGYAQRAAVEGYMLADDPKLGRLIREARAAGLRISAHGAGRATGPARGIDVCRVDRETRLSFGGRQSLLDRRSMWRGTGRRARRQLARDAVFVAVADPQYGRDDVLWPLLAEVFGAQVGAPSDR